MVSEGEQELFFEAVYADAEMSDADKVRWLHHSAKDYWQRLEWAEKRYAARDAEASGWAEQATRNAAEIARLRDVLGEISDDPAHAVTIALAVLGGDAGKGGTR